MPHENRPSSKDSDRSPSKERDSHGKGKEQSGKEKDHSPAKGKDHSPGKGKDSQSPSKRGNKFTINLQDMQTPDDEFLRGLFDQIDVNHNGTLDRQEFRDFIMNHYEDYGLPNSEKDIDRLFKKLDHGSPKKEEGKNDGKLSFEEFCVLILAKIAQ